MIYELFVGWRYLYAPRRSFSLRVAFVVGAVLALGGSACLFFQHSMTLGAVSVLLGVLVLMMTLLLRLLTTFTAISVMGISIGVAILIWVLSITSGFQREFRDKVLGVNAHLLVLKYGTDFAEYREVMRKSLRLKDVAAAAPFVFNEMMLAKGSRLSGVLVKGIDPQHSVHVLDLPKYIKKPADARRAERLTRLFGPARSSSTGAGASSTPGIIIGAALAEKLKADIGDPVRLMSPLSHVAGWISDGSMPRSYDFNVAAIFDSGFDEYDRRLIYLHIRDAQAFFDQGDVATGVEMKLNDVFAAPKVAQQLDRRLGGPYRTVDWSELNHNLFKALNMQKLFLEIVIGFIVVVAAFNVLSALAVLVLRKRREIAILRSLGMSAGGIARVFQGAGLLIWFAGTSLGLALGYIGAIVLRRYAFQLDAKVYLINSLPVDLNAREFVITAAFALAICVLATLYPAIRAARMDPIRGLRYN